MKISKYSKSLQPLLRKPFFTFSEASKQGITRQALDYFIKKGVLTRVCPGIYRASDYEPKVEFQWENLALIAASIPNGVICLISALSFYDLTDQIMREIWIAVAHNSHPPKRPNTRIIRMRNFELGINQLKLGEYQVRIFDRERSVIDAFRYLSKEIALKALQYYFRGAGYRPQPKKLEEYAKALRVDIAPYILAYTT